MSPTLDEYRLMSEPVSSDRKKKYRLPCNCSKAVHLNGCSFVWYDHYEYAKFLKKGIYKLCDSCQMCDKHSPWDDIPIF